jgi:hypothetical protein
MGARRARSAPRIDIELALSHHIGGVRGAYNHSKYLPQRRDLLQAWADQCTAWGMRLP